MTHLIVKKRNLITLTFWLAMLISLMGVSISSANAEGMCGVPTTATLFAGQSIDAGTVTVENDENYLYVTYTTANGWYLGETHLHVADSLAGIPSTRNGNPKVGNFSYQRSYDPMAKVNTDTYIIPKDALSLDNNNSVIVAAHAFLVQLDESGNVITRETGWAEGPRFTDRGNWAMYLQYTWQTCNGDDDGTSTTETAFAFGGTNAIDGYEATCFLEYDLNQDGQNDFNRWGWSNGPLAPGSYTFDLYAAAGQCDLTKGTLIGTLTIEYDGLAATVTYHVNPPYTLVETHLYIGSDYLPKNNGEYTVAPGQYPSIHSELANVYEDIYMVTNLSGDIYVVAHGTVAGF